jgi:hypothetical protein
VKLNLLDDGVVDTYVWVSATSGVRNCGSRSGGDLLVLRQRLSRGRIGQTRTRALPKLHIDDHEALIGVQCVPHVVFQEGAYSWSLKDT